jgi:hypothetical protein
MRLNRRALLGAAGLSTSSLLFAPARPGSCEDLTALLARAEALEDRYWALKASAGPGDWFYTGLVLVECVLGIPLVQSLGGPWELQCRKAPTWLDAAESYLKAGESGIDPLAGAYAFMVGYRCTGDDFPDYALVQMPQAPLTPLAPVDIDFRFHSAGTWGVRAAHLRPRPSYAVAAGHLEPQTVRITPALRGDTAGRGLGEGALEAVMRWAIRRYGPCRLRGRGASLGGTTAAQWAARWDQVTSIVQVTAGTDYGMGKGSSARDHPYLDPMGHLSDIHGVRWGILAAPADQHYQRNLELALRLDVLDPGGDGLYPHRLAVDPYGAHGRISAEVADPVYSWAADGPGYIHFPLDEPQRRYQSASGGPLETMELADLWVVADFPGALDIWRRVWGPGDVKGFQYAGPAVNDEDAREVCPNIARWVVAHAWQSLLAAAALEETGFVATPSGVTFRDTFYAGASVMGAFPNPFSESGRIVLIPPDWAGGRAEFYNCPGWRIRRRTSTGREQVLAQGF